MSESPEKFQSDYPGVEYKSERDVLVEGSSESMSEYQTRYDASAEYQKQQLRAAALEAAVQTRNGTESVIDIITNAKALEDYLIHGTLPGA